MLGMSKRRNTRPPEEDPEKRRPNRSGVPLHIYISRELRQAINELAEENRRLITTEVVIALENHLKAAGRWPPPGETGQPPGD